LGVGWLEPGRLHQMEQVNAVHADVVVIGAGIAGIAAAHQLSRSGLNVSLLEARDRPGGRILTLHPASLAAPIELGAEFVHGKPPTICEIVEREGLEVEELTGEPWCGENDQLQKCDELFAEVDKIFEALEKTKSDCSFAEFLQHHGQQFSEKAKERAVSYVEGFHAADRNRISIRSLIKSNEADKGIHGDRQFRIRAGYDSVLQSLLRELPKHRVELLLNTPVKVVNWSPGRVSIQASLHDQGRQQFVAAAAIITLPLGVLKTAPGSPSFVQFAPSLAQKREALDGLEMGGAVRVSFQFKRRFWAEPEFSVPKAHGDLSQMGFLFASRAEFPTWWTMMPREAPVLTGWEAGPRAQALAGLDESQVTRRALTELADILGVEIGALETLVERGYTHDWQRDPFSEGAYSYALVGGMEASRELARPIADTLFFAGEATDFSGHHATVHGALASGYRAANEVLRMWQQRVAS